MIRSFDGLRTLLQSRRPENIKRLRGNVKWFDVHRGYGFIELEDGRDILVHHSAIQMADFERLTDGERVEFNVVQGQKGPRAEKVIRV